MNESKKRNRWIIGAVITVGAAVGVYWWLKRSGSLQKATRTTIGVDVKGKPLLSSQGAKYFNASGNLIGPESWKLEESYKPYKTTKIFDKDTVPKALLKDHNTATNVDALIHVVEGKLIYTTKDSDPPNQEFTLVPGHCGIIKSKLYHKVTIAQENTQFYVEFWK